MNALVAMIALASGMAEANLPSKWTPTFQNDYRQAKLQAAEVGKPLAVFIGSGKTGWEMVAREGIDEKSANLLNTKYVCLYVDIDTNAGQKLATAFEVKNKGLIISDRSGDTQAFYHNGDLTQADLNGALEKYADPARIAVSTDTAESYAPTLVPAPQPVYGRPMYPQYYQPGMMRSYGTMSSGGCPNCR